MRRIPPPRWLGGLAIQLLWEVAPKRRVAAILSTPAFDDSTRAMVPALRRRGVTVLVVGVPDGVVVPEWLPPGVRVVRGERSPATVLALATSRYVFLTHHLFDGIRLTARQVRVLLWHGMPIKKLGLQRHNITSDVAGRDRAGGVAFTLATSEEFRSVVMASFGMAATQVRVDGLPRNDILRDPPPADRRALLDVLGLGDVRYVVYLPTFRQQSGAPTADGSAEACHPTDAELEALDARLADAGLHLVVKPHYGDPQASLYARWSTQRIHTLTQPDLQRAKVTLYGLLGGAAALITDYSSVAIDFLVTEKPIVFFQPDRSTYASNRGLNFTPEELGALGASADSFSALPSAISAAFELSRSPEAVATFYSAPFDGAADRVAAAALAHGTSR